METIYRLTARENGFREAGETSGFAKGLAQAAKDLRKAAEYYDSLAKNNRDYSDFCSRITEPFENIAKQLDVQAGEAQKISAQRLAEASKLMSDNPGLRQRLRSAIHGALSGAKRGWENR